MTRDEFHEWLKHHRACFSSMTKWLDGLKSVRQEVVDRWFRELESFQLADAKSASTALLKSPNKPFKYEDHLAEIIGRCREMGVKRSLAREHNRFASTGARCQWCQGDGQTAIFGRVDPQTRSISFAAFIILADIQTDGVGETNLRTFGVRCVCAAGQKYQGLPAFDPEQHVAAEGGPMWRRGDSQFWSKVAARFERSSVAAFAGGVPSGGF